MNKTRKYIGSACILIFVAMLGYGTIEFQPSLGGAVGSAGTFENFPWPYLIIMLAIFVIGAVLLAKKSKNVSSGL